MGYRYIDLYILNTARGEMYFICFVIKYDIFETNKPNNIIYGAERMAVAFTTCLERRIGQVSNDSMQTVRTEPVVQIEEMVI